ncbi:MAG: hypothetical protein IK076_01070 [Bacteroidales bacterium]|nr:hypothetical protein [Bacteroidales bacterium]
MKYLRRAVKYFFWFALILAITLTVMVALGLVEADPKDMFREGTKSLWQIAALFVILAAIYPLSGFRKKEIYVPAGDTEVRDKLVKLMENKGYVLEKEEGDDLCFRLRTSFGRWMKMLEDRITVTIEPGSLVLEGLRRDVVRIASFLEFKLNDNNSDEYSKT